jgi:hypothetical protein
MADPTVHELDEFFTASKNVRRPFEAQWYLNMAFHDGRQWIAFDGRQLFEPQLEPWRAKLTDNRLRGMVRKEIARMTKARPQWVGVPGHVGGRRDRRGQAAGAGVRARLAVPRRGPQAKAPPRSGRRCAATGS